MADLLAAEHRAESWEPPGTWRPAAVPGCWQRISLGCTAAAAVVTVLVMRLMNASGAKNAAKPRNGKKRKSLPDFSR